MSDNEQAETVSTGVTGLSGTQPEPSPEEDFIPFQRSSLTPDGIATYAVMSKSRKGKVYYPSINLTNGQCDCTCEDYECTRRPAFRTLKQDHDAVPTIGDLHYLCKHLIDVVADCVKRGEIELEIPHRRIASMQEFQKLTEEQELARLHYIQACLNSVPGGNGFQSGPSGGTLIFEKIPAIIREVGAVAKSRKNASQGFQFRGVDDIYNALHGLLGKHEIFSVPMLKEIVPGEMATKNGSMRHIQVTVDYKFFAKDGSSFTACVPGEAADTGDKSAGKAMSYAHKLALIQIFALETNEQQDPDYELPDLTPATNQTHPRSSSPQTRQAAPQQSAPASQQASPAFEPTEAAPRQYNNNNNGTLRTYNVPAEAEESVCRDCQSTVYWAAGLTKSGKKMCLNGDGTVHFETCTAKTQDPALLRHNDTVLGADPAAAVAAPDNPGAVPISEKNLDVIFQKAIALWGDDLAYNEVCLLVDELTSGVKKTPEELSHAEGRIVYDTIFGRLGAGGPQGGIATGEQAAMDMAMAAADRE